MAALSQFLTLLVIFLSASNANAFNSLSPVARNHVWVNHLIWFEPSCKPTNELMIERTNNQKNVQTNEHEYENYFQPLRFSNESISGSTNNNVNNTSELINIKTSGSTNNNVNNASELINIKLVGSCHNKKSEQVGNSASSQPWCYVYQTIMPQKLGLWQMNWWIIFWKQLNVQTVQRAKCFWTKWTNQYTVGWLMAMPNWDQKSKWANCISLNNSEWANRNLLTHWD